MCRNRRARRNARAFRSDRRHRQSQSIPRGARSLGEEFPIRHTKENSMCRPIESMSDAALLSTLVGPRTAANLLKDASGSLSRLLNADVAQQVPSSSVGAKLMAARELVRRALAETMRERDMLASPAAVRDYLRIMLAQRDHEVFMVLFLDAQNRVIAPEEMFRGTLTQTSVYPREVVKRRAVAERCGSDPGAQPPVGCRRAQPGRRVPDPVAALRAGPGRHPCARPHRDRRQQRHLVRRTRFCCSP